MSPLMDWVLFQRAAFLASTQHIRPSHAPDAVDRSPPELVELREQCWHRDPSQRPSFSDVLSTLSAMHVTDAYDGADHGESERDDFDTYSISS